MFKLLCCFIADGVEAIHDLWITGSDFLKEIINGLHALKTAATVNNKEPPYVFQQFNIINQQAKYIDIGLLKFINPLIRCINEENKLPKILVILPDRDILTILQKEDAISAMVIGASLHYIVKQINVTIDRYKQQLVAKKPGALLSEEFPKIIWIRMLKRPKIQSNLTLFHNVYNLRGKFNSILEERLQDGNAPNHYLMSTDIPEGEFDISGNLTSAGKSMFWNEFNKV